MSKYKCSKSQDQTWLNSGCLCYPKNLVFEQRRYGLLILGVVIAWGNLLGWLGLLSYLVLAYFVTLIEEEHLTRTYEQSYRDYCARVPRFIGLLKKQHEVQEH